MRLIRTYTALPPFALARKLPSARRALPLPDAAERRSPGQSSTEATKAGRTTAS